MKQEELQRSKEAQTHAQTIYEKEVRRARKEAFKSSSALVKLQEELKSARNKYTLIREEAEAHRRDSVTKEGEVLAAQSHLVELQDEMERQKQQNKIIEEERDASRASLKEMETARREFKQDIAQSLCGDGDGDGEEGEVIASGKKRSRRSESMKENMDPEAPQLHNQLKLIEGQLRMEKQMRLRADDQVHFLKMECQFRCCSCRIAERQEIAYIHDDTLTAQMAAMAEMAPKLAKESGEPASEMPTGMNLEAVARSIPVSARDQQPSTPLRQPYLQRQNTDPNLLNFSPTTGTFYKVPSPTKPILSPPAEGIPEPSPQTPHSTPQATNLPSLPTSPSQPNPSFTFPHIPRPLPVAPQRTISYTKTVTIPLKDDMPFTPVPATPGGISREDALEQIRQRRGRARSIAAGSGTPRKRMVEIGELRRDISAPGRV